MKTLDEMTLPELWELFPIELVPHKDEWAQQYLREARCLRFLFPEEEGCVLTHVGSTAVPGICSKDIVDILCEVPVGSDLTKYRQGLTALGYRFMWQTGERAHYNRGYTLEGFSKEVFHLHLRYWGDRDEVYFKNYLILHPDVAKEYEQLKLSLEKPYKHDRDGYTRAKADFIKAVVEKAKKEL